MVESDSPEDALSAFKKAKPAVVDSEIKDVREVPKTRKKNGRLQSVNFYRNNGSG